jgi:hypothetical protein
MAKIMSQRLFDAPEALRTRLQGNLPAAADEWNKVKDRVLGAQGSHEDRARPGEPPRMQSGHLRARTVAVPAASSLTISIYTTEVGKYQDEGTSIMLGRPFVEQINRQAEPAMQEALRKPGRASVYHA